MFVHHVLQFTEYRGKYNHEIYSSRYYMGFIISSNTVRIQGSIKTNISLKPHTARNSMIAGWMVDQIVVDQLPDFSLIQL